MVTLLERCLNNKKQTWSNCSGIPVPDAKEKVHGDGEQMDDDVIILLVLIQKSEIKCNTW